MNSEESLIKFKQEQKKLIEDTRKQFREKRIKITMEGYYCNYYIEDETETALNMVEFHIEKYGDGIIEINEI